MEFHPAPELLVSTRKKLVNDMVSRLGTLPCISDFTHTQQEYDEIVDRLVETYGINRDDLATPDNLHS